MKKSPRLMLNVSSNLVNNVLNINLLNYNILISCILDECISISSKTNKKDPSDCTIISQDIMVTALNF